MATINVDGYQKRAQALYVTYQKTIADAQANPAWSHAGVADVARQALTTYQAGMTALQEQARFEVQAEKTRNSQARTAAQRAEMERVRAILGDALYSDLVRRRLETMDSAAIVEAVAQAPSDFDRELLRAYGGLLVAQRAAAEEHTVADVAALAALQEAQDAPTAALDTEAAALAGAERWIRGMDAVGADAERARLAAQIHRDF